MAIRINDFLCGLFAAIDIRLIDFKLEFGRLFDGDYSRVILADEISPRQARFWQESTTKEKAIFCDVAGVSPAYRLTAWADIPDKQRARLWAAIVDVTKWGERLRGRF